MGTVISDCVSSSSARISIAGRAAGVATWAVTWKPLR
jgi:hypothetical protein